MSILDEQTWENVKRIFAEALELPARDLERYLDKACGGDETLRAETASLLAAHDRTEHDSDFLSPFEDTQPDRDSNVGRRVGPYRLERHLGSGGMGAVYLAGRDEGDFEQRVAIKFVRGVDPGAVQRFETERQILARLEHPNIARLLGGGLLEDGLPYLAMEFIEGEPLTQYCEKRNLSLADRLGLFMHVCNAVQYAHNSLVIHRDLKPSNILVAEDGVVKLLDFGIAKLFDPSHETGPPTLTQNRAMTPGYASPEQLRGESVTTQSDVYALGVLLYELLAGRPPYETSDKTPHQLEQLVCETTPPGPSSTARHAWGRKLRGDLDTIVATAMHRDLARRTGSARELAQDIARHLAGQPVQARADSAIYRLGKFVSRNRVGVAVSAGIVAIIAAGVLATLRQTRIAEQRFEDVRSIANTQLIRLHDAIRDVPGTTEARRELVDTALRYLNQLEAQGAHDQALQLEIAEGFERVGEVQGDPNYPNLGDLGASLASYERALAIREQVLALDPRDLEHTYLVAHSRGRLANVLSWSGRNEDMFRESESAVRMLGEVLEREPAHARAFQDRAQFRSAYGWSLIWAGRLDEGKAMLEDARADLEAVVREHPDELEPRLLLASTLNYECDFYRFRMDWASSIELLRQAFALLEPLHEQYPGHPRVGKTLRSTGVQLGLSLHRHGEVEEAVATLRRAIEVSEALQSRDPMDRTAREGVALAYGHLGKVIVDTPESSEGFALLERAVEIRKALAAENPENIELRNALAGAHGDLADAGRRTETNLREALGHAERSAALQQELIAIEARSTFQGNFAIQLFQIAALHQLLASNEAGDAGEDGEVGEDEIVIRLEKSRETFDRCLAVLDEMEKAGTLTEIYADTRREGLEERAKVVRMLADRTGGRG